MSRTPAPTQETMSRVPDEKPFSFAPRAKRPRDVEAAAPVGDEVAPVEDDDTAVVEDAETSEVDAPGAGAVEVADSNTENDTDSDTPTPRRFSAPALVAIAVAVVGLLVLALGGVSWYRASHDDGLDTARARDRALVAATTEVATLNSLDYRRIDAGLKAWSAATTGTLHDQLAQAGAKDKATLAAQKKITTAKVVGAALTDLDVERGTATAITSVEITVRGTSGEPVLKRNRFSADLTLTKKGWLLSSLTQVPVDVS